MKDGVIYPMPPVRLGARAWCLTCAVLSSALTLSSPAFSQGTVETAQQTNERIRQLSIMAQRVQRDYVIGSGDLLAVEVFDVAELSREVRVSAAGTIALPLLPMRLHVTGLTEVQLEQKIAEILEANGLVTHPQVSVTVKEKRSKPITVIGAVGHPLVYQAIRPVTLLEVLSEAGGIANDAGSIVNVRRGAPGATADLDAAGLSAPGSAASAAAKPSPDSAVPSVAGAPGENAKPGQPDAVRKPVPQDDPQPPDLSDEAVSISINLNDLLESGDPKYNIPLEGGDVVIVPRAGVVYVIGAVGRPGGFVLSNDREQMSTLKLLSLAGGLGRTARGDKAVILRKDAAGQQQQTPVDLKKILQRKTEDVALHPSDILFVPESGGKQALIRATEIALGVGTAAVIFRMGR